MKAEEKIPFGADIFVGYSTTKGQSIFIITLKRINN
jgi:hypothetical protein